MDWNRLKRVTAPTEQPLTLEELRAWLRLDLSDEDPLVDQLIRDAVDYVEGPHGIGVALMAQTWEYALDGFPGVIRIPLGPVQSVDAIEYTDTEGTEQTLDAADYQVDTVSQPARIVPAHDATWPATRDVLNAVTVTFTAGYDEVPGDLKRAMALLVGHWHQNRQAVVIGTITAEMPLAVEAILNKYRVGRVA